MYHPMSHGGAPPNPPQDVEALLYEMAMARNYMSAQLGNGLPPNRQRPSRVVKSNSTSSSPQQRQQRRRTFASTHRMVKFNSDVPTHTFQSLMGAQPVAQEQYVAQPTAPRARPMSWHPSTMASTNVGSYNYQPEMSYRHSVNNYPRTVGSCGMPTPMTQPDLNEDMSMDTDFALCDLDSAYHHAEPQSGYYSAPKQAPLQLYAGYGESPAVHHGMTYSTPTPVASSNYPTFSPNATSGQSWMQCPSEPPACTAPPTPDLLPVQKPQEPEIPPLERKDSKELIGMGLYDNPDRFSLMTESFGNGGKLGLEQSVGKGLKLEETWEPPEEEDESGDEDDGEEEEEEDGDSDEPEASNDDEIEEVKRSTPEQTNIAPTTSTVEEKATYMEDGLTTETFRQLYNDMSSSSFYFDNCEDNYMTAAVGQSNGGMMYGAGQPLVMDGTSMWLKGQMF